MTVQRMNHNATLLNDGTVLITGGSSKSTSVAPVASADDYIPNGDFFINVSDMNDSRSSHTATLLNDGTVLIAGGASGNNPILATNALPSAEIYDPIKQVFNQLSAVMSDSRVSHTATLLQDGTVLVAGGMDDTLIDLSTADIYDPVQHSFSRTGVRMGTVRSQHTATALVDGTVLIAGGATTASNSGNSSEADLFDGTPGAFVPSGQMLVPRQFHTATMLQDGSARIFIAGGQNEVDGALNSSELYDGTNYSAGPVLTTSRSFHTATAFRNGSTQQVLIAGGVTTAGGVTATAEIYTPVAGAIGSVAATTNTMTNSPVGRFGHTATLLSNGDILIAGGEDKNGIVQNSSDLFVPDTLGNGSFDLSRVSTKGKSTHNLVTGRVYHTATTLCDGTVLLAGGRDANSNYLSSAEIYTPTTDSFASAGSGKTGGMITARAFHTATLLPDCSILIAGGANSKGSLNAAELYVPGVSTSGKSAAGKFVALVPMNSSRDLHSATMLPDGTVMLAGGESGSASVDNSGEIYNPFLQSFTPAAGLMLTARYGQAAVTLNSGFVLIAGGATGSFTVTASSELYDPPSGPHAGGAAVTTAPAAVDARAGHHVKAGSAWIVNQSNLFETITDATLTLSDPSVFASVTMTSDVGGDGDATKYKAPGTSTDLVFDPPITLAPGGAFELKFKGRLAGKAHGQTSAQTITGMNVTNPLGAAVASGLPASLGTVTEK
jgi:N-acetylneuraminic acid mutarotase